MEPLLYLIVLITAGLLLYIVVDHFNDQRKFKARKEIQKAEEEKYELLVKMRKNLQAESERLKQAKANIPPPLTVIRKPHIDPATGNPYPGYTKFKDKQVAKPTTKVYTSPSPRSSNTYSRDTYRNDNDWIAPVVIADSSDDFVRAVSSIFESSSSSASDCGSIVSDIASSCSWD